MGHLETEDMTQGAQQVLRLPSVDRVVGLMPGFVYVFNHVTSANDYTNRDVGLHLGYSSDEIRALGDQMMAHLVHPDDLPLLGAHMGTIASLAPEQTAALEYRVLTKNGETRWLRSVDCVFDRAEDGTVLRHIGCASDITAEKQAQLELAQLNAALEQTVAARTRDLAELNAQLEERIALRTEELEDAVEELEQLTYIATHDLKVPVNNLSRLALMLGDCADTLSEEQREQVGWINECANQLMSKIQGLVLVAQVRLSSNFEPEKLDMQRLVSDVVARLRPHLPAPAQLVRVEVPEGIYVSFARPEIESILHALMDNAVKYADPARPLDIVVHGGVRAGRPWLRISDTGSGLDPLADKAKVFGLFQRAHKAPAGNGISLYCAKRILSRQGGRITFDGARGEGASFTIKFRPQGDVT